MVPYFHYKSSFSFQLLQIMLHVYTLLVKTIRCDWQKSVLGDDGASYYPFWVGKKVKEGGSAGIRRYELHFLHQIRGT